MRHHPTSIVVLAGLALAFGGAGAALAGPPTASERVEKIVGATEARGLHTPTLKEIMRRPSWVSRPPSGASWADDSRAVYFSREREGDEGIRDTWVIRFDASGVASEPEIVPDADLATLPNSFGDERWVGDERLKVFTRGKGVWLKSMTDGWERLLLNTAGRRGRPMFVRGGAAVAWAEDRIVVRDLASGLIEQPVRIVLEDEPDPLEKKWAEQDKKRSEMEKQQERLFETIRDGKSDSRAREAVREARDQADTSEIPVVRLGTKHLGKKFREVGQAINDDTRWLAVSVREESKDAPRDVMPMYVNADGTVKTRPVRPNVGLGEPANTWIALVDIENRKAHWLDWSELPGVREDPLAWLKEQREAEKKAGEKKAAEKKGDAEKDAEPEADEKAAEAKSDDTKPEASMPEDVKPEEAKPEEPKPEEPKPEEPKKEPPLRKVGTLRWSWSDDGSQLAVMLRSEDNKDRWLVCVDVTTGEPEMRVVEHQREEGWINWSYNEMGWLPDGRLWFTSEKPGYSGLYLYDGSEPSLVTGEGEFTVQNVTESPDSEFLYYRTNRHDPTRYEVERVSTATGMVQAVTGMGGSVDSYDLSPSGERVLFTFSTVQDPPELYVTSADGAAKPVRLTQTDSAEYRGFDWVTPEFVAVPSSHVDQPIHALVWEDPDAPSRNPGQPKPVVIFVHGAGYLQDVVNGWSHYWREHMMHTLLARAGYIVIGPDFRASAGYGSAWRQAIYRRMGEPELQDLDDCIAWLGAQRGADSTKVGIYGGSYGGFLSLMAMFDRPGVYAAGAALRPVTDWTHYNDGYTSNILNTPQIDPEAYLRSSPIEKAERFRENGSEGRLLILHGMVDDNVVFQDSVRLAQRLIELEKENWEIAPFPVEAHGFEEPTGWLHEYRKIFRMFEEELATD